MHVCIDDASRIAFSQVMKNEKRGCAVAFLKAAVAYYASLGVTVERVMTNNGSCYKSFAFQKACKRLGLKHIRSVRAAEFGHLERRMLGHDFRRSGAIEAIAGDATPAALSHAMGNTLSASNSLFATYVPVNATTIKTAFEARKKGRRSMR